MAGLVGGMKIAKLLAIIIIPVAFAAIVTASVFAYLFFRNKRRFASQTVRLQQSLQESHFHRCMTLYAIGASLITSGQCACSLWRKDGCNRDWTHCTCMH